MRLPRIINKILLRYFPKNYVQLHKSGWYGNFNSWQEAKSHTTGYEAENILNKVKESLLKIKNGEAVYERDSVLFDKIEYSWPLLTAFMWIAVQNSGKLHLIDFGGSLGSTYYQNKTFLDSLPNATWNIVEQPNFVKTGIEAFQDDRIRFHTSIRECCSNSKDEISAALFSGVLQYLEFPYEILKETFYHQIEYIIIDRTSFTLNNKERITIQKVPDSIYQASYPCRFFSEKEFISFFKKNHYTLIVDFDALDNANIPSKYKGFVFKRNATIL
jgi:putative methyltransferase (TIGR04325 family)